MRKIIHIILGDYFLRQKINYIRYSLSRRNTHLKYKPITLSVVSTSRCTLSCDMCPTHSTVVPRDYKWRQNPTRDIDFELFKKTLDLFPEALNVQIIGSGEPMLNRDFFKMVEYAKDIRRMNVKTFSSGTTIRDNMDNLLKSNLDSLTVSINGHTRDEFSRMTGMRGEIFDGIYLATKELIKEKKRKSRRLKVKLSFIIDKVNYRCLPEMIDFSDKLNPDYVFFCNFLPCWHEGFTPRERAITKDDSDIIDFIRKIKEGLPAEKRGKISFPAAIDPGMKENKCLSHFEQLRINGDGNVSSCSMMLLNMENAARIDEKDPWNSTFFADMRKKFLENRNLDELCFYCPSNKGIEI